MILHSPFEMHTGGQHYSYYFYDFRPFHLDFGWRDTCIYPGSFWRKGKSWRLFSILCQFFTTTLSIDTFSTIHNANE